MDQLSNRAYVLVKRGYGKPMLFTSPRAATDYALAMIYSYDTPQGADEADYLGRTIIEVIKDGYNIIDVAYGLHTRAINKDVKQLALTLNADIRRSR
jgi:hypothetical protein